MKTTIELKYMRCRKILLVPANLKESNRLQKFSRLTNFEKSAVNIHCKESYMHRTSRGQRKRQKVIQKTIQTAVHVPVCDFEQKHWRNYKGTNCCRTREDKMQQWYESRKLCALPVTQTHLNQTECLLFKGCVPFAKTVASHWII